MCARALLFYTLTPLTLTLPRPSVSDPHSALAGRDRRRLLCLLHDPIDESDEYEMPKGTPAFLDERPALESPCHVHLRMTRPADFRRLARIVSGTAIGLVLGGGGARGIAHLGALRALEALNIEVDYVGGCSQGAVTLTSTVPVPAATPARPPSSSP